MLNDNLIRRGDVITQLSHNKSKGDDEWQLAVGNDIQTVWNIPSAKDDWIPVEEQLPPDGEKVLVCGKSGGIYTAIHNKSDNLRGWWKLNSKSHYCKPLYWMPLPKLPDSLRGNK